MKPALSVDVFHRPLVPIWMWVSGRSFAGSPFAQLVKKKLPQLIQDHFPILFIFAPSQSGRFLESLVIRSFSARVSIETSLPPDSSQIFSAASHETWAMLARYQCAGEAVSFSASGGCSRRAFGLAG